MLQSALTAFSRHGYDGVGVREIAQTAGVTAVIMRKPEPLGQPNDALLLLLRSAPNPRAAEILRDTIARRMERPLKSLLPGPGAGERAAMILALILGFLLMRRVIGCKAVSDANGREPFRRVEDDVSTTDR
jgi:hypothetical protein